MKTDTTAPAPVSNAPLEATETPSVPSFDTALSVVIDGLKARIAEHRPDILSAWGRYAIKGEVAPIDRGVVLDAKRVPDLLRAAKDRGESRLMAQCEAFVSASRALAAIAKL